MRYDPATRDRLLGELRRTGLPPALLRILELVPEGSRVLDLGCATGYLAERLAARGCRVVGVELDPEMAATAERVCPVVHQLDLDDPTAWDALEGPFDVVLAADVLEHLKDPWDALRSIRPRLSGAGRILTSLPNAAAWPMRRHLLLGRFEYAESGPRDRTHLRFFTIRSFHQAAEETGYRVQQMLPSEGWLPGTGWLAGVPGLGRAYSGLARRAGGLWPNLLCTHAIWVLEPRKDG